MEQNQQTTILVVDDDEISRVLLATLITAEGHAVRSAADGEEAMASVAEQLPDLILLDIMMPGIDGFEVAHRLKADARTRAIPIIMVTALEDRESRLKGLEMGADEFLSKPVDYTELQLRVRNLLKIKAYQDLLTHYNVIMEKEVKARTASLLAEEQKLTRSNRALRTLSACNTALVWAKSEEELFQTICRHIVETGEHLFAGICFPGSEPENIPYFVANFGDNAIRLCLIELQHKPEYIRYCPTHAALKTHQTTACNKTRDNGACGLDNLSGLGIESALALPLINGGHLYGVLTVFSSNQDAFDAAEIKLMEELAGDIAYGIVTLRTYAERDRAVAAELHSAAGLRKALEQTISAIALTLEKRDPYAAGHQQRVAKLATAVATELGLSVQQVEGIGFGALLHNIGKVAIPSEILNRPCKLTDLQFSLIKTHAQIGFDIVKDIPFPWPVAQMVLQHHERLDGSGYPQQLKGEQIMLEARILAVTDVLEAMIAHRPYRAALSMDAALAVLIQGRGTRFDFAVVDACLRVVKQPGYH